MMCFLILRQCESRSNAFFAALLSLMDMHGIEQDPRARNPCVGYACYFCTHPEACSAGETDLLCTSLLYVPRQEYVNGYRDIGLYLLLCRQQYRGSHHPGGLFAFRLASHFAH